MFHSARTVGNSGTQHLVVALTCPDMQSTMEHILPNIIERMHGVTKRTRTSIEQLPKKVSHVLMSSNTLTAKETIKQIVTSVYLGITVSTGIGMVKNNRNSFKSRVYVI